MTPRKPRYLQSPSGHIQDRWLISYTDVVTILLILFVSIAAQGMKTRAPEPKPQPVPAPARTTLREAQRKLEQQGLDPKLEPRGLVISLPQAILFASGEDRINADALPTIEKIAAVILETNNKIVLVGHADTIPIHNQRFKSNWDLSAARSLALLNLLIGEFRVPESRLSIQSYGSNQPRDSNDTESGRAANRRVEILLLDDHTGRRPSSKKSPFEFTLSGTVPMSRLDGRTPH